VKALQLIKKANTRCYCMSRLFHAHVCYCVVTITKTPEKLQLEHEYIILKGDRNYKVFNSQTINYLCKHR